MKNYASANRATGVRGRLLYSATITAPVNATDERYLLYALKA